MNDVVNQFDEKLLLDRCNNCKLQILSEKIFNCDEEIIITGALKSLAQKGNKLNYINFCLNIRQLVILYMNRVSPEAKVKKTEWFIPDKNTNSGVSTKHKLIYSIFFNTPESFFKFCEEELMFSYETKIKNLGTKLKELNGFVHFSRDKLSISYTESLKKALEVLESLHAFINVSKEIEKQLSNEYERYLYPVISEYLSENIPDDVDIKATHSFFDSVNIELIETSLDFLDRSINVCVSGTLDYDHQFGSDGDLKRGDGIEFSDSYSFEANLFSTTYDPTTFSHEEYNWIVVDD